MTYNDKPIMEVLELARQLVKTGSRVHQKFTCSHCGSRQTIEQHNQIFASGTCEECKQVTEIRECGLMVIHTF